MIEPRATFLVNLTMIKNTAIPRNTNNQFIPITNPTVHAAPLPPLNLKNTGHMCPTTAANPAA